jgi:hypothetical protein
LSGHTHIRAELPGVPTPKQDRPESDGAWCQAPFDSGPCRAALIQYRLGTWMEVRPVAERVAQRRRWAVRLPMLLALLLAVVSATVSPTVAQAPSVGEAAVTLSGATPAYLSASGNRPDVRLLAKRGGTWLAGPVAAAGCLAAYRLAPPAGRWTVRALECRLHSAGASDTYQGRGPPEAV